jgi:Reverse transcriptase (RNA-dependent DNA polymerase)
MFVIDGYHCPVFMLRNNSQGGGVAIYVKNSLNFSVISKYSTTIDKILDCLFIEVRTASKKKFIIGNFYRTNARFTAISEKYQYETFSDLLSNFLTDINESGIPTYIVGDFNLDILKFNSCENCTDYINNLFLHGFLQIVSRPTRCTNTSATLLDHILTNDIRVNYDTCILLSKMSDHFPVISFLNSEPKPSNEYIVTRFLTEPNILRFKENLSNINWSHVTDCIDTQLSYDLFSETFLDLYNLHFPITRVKLNRNIHKLEQWFTQGLLVSRRRKLYLAKCAIKSPSIINKESYNQYRNVYNRIVRASKKLCFENELEKHKANLKVTWDLLRKAIRQRKVKKTSIDSICCNGNIINDPKEIANFFNTFFTTVADSISNEIHPTVRPPEISSNETPLFNLAENPITNFEILTVLTELKNKKSEDYSGLSMFLLKNVTLQILSPLCHIFNLSFSQGIVPKQLKIAKVVPIFKSGDPLLLDNYRPISLLSNFSKILEKLMCNRLTRFLENNNLISKSQFGFRKKQSTIHPILHLINEVTSASNLKKYTVAIFCDLRKAFDTCDHEILCKKLHNLGIRGTELDWFVNYLQERMQFVTINGVESTKLEIKKGVPQGSILGPILFLIYINDLPQCSALITFLFADDTTLLASGENLQDLILFVSALIKWPYIPKKPNSLFLTPLSKP